MKIGSFQRCSRTDYPGKIAAVVYTQGCNWRCPYCHNRSLIIPARFQPSIPEEEIFAHLGSSIDQIDAVVVTGGEPTLQLDLADFLRRVKQLGYATKLATNGSRPGVLSALFEAQLLDFVALDLKGPLSSYERFAGLRVETGMVELSLELVRTSGVDYELCTTLVGGLHTPSDLQELAPLIHGARRYAVQSYRPAPAAKGRSLLSVPGPGLFHDAGVLLRDHVDEFVTR